MQRLNKTNIITILTLLVILVAVFLLSYFFIFNKEKSLENSSIKKTLTVGEGKKSFTDIEGNPVTLEDDFGKIVVVFAWASWCPECAEDLKLIDEFAAEYADKQVKVIAVNRAENKIAAKRFLDSLGEFNNFEVVLDPDDAFFDTLEGFAMPEIVVYDQDGEILLHQRGRMNLDEVKASIPEGE